MFLCIGSCEASNNVFYFVCFCEWMQILEGLVKLPDNRECADCGTKYVPYFHNPLFYVDNRCSCFQEIIHRHFMLFVENLLEINRSRDMEIRVSFLRLVPCLLDRIPLSSSLLNN